MTCITDVVLTENQEVIQEVITQYEVLDATQDTSILTTVLTEVIQEVQISQELLEVGIQGPPGIPGTGGGTSEPILDTDYSDSTFAYVGFASKITRVDYSVSPPGTKKYIVTNYEVDWTNRYSLIYS